jgi:hypothetical protein
MILPLLSAFAFGFGAIASKRSEDGGERAGVRADVIPDVMTAWRPVHHSPALRNDGGPVHHSPALRNDGGSFTRPAAWPRGAALRGQPDFSFPPCFLSWVVLVEKVAKPLETKDFDCPEIVQKKFKKKLTLPCSFVIFISHTVTTEQKNRKQYEN